MYLYRAYGLYIASSILLPEAVRAEHGKADCKFQLLSANTQGPDRKLDTYLSSEDNLLSYARYGKSYVLRFKDMADFLIEDNCRSISCFAKDNVALETIRHLLLDQALPHSLAQNDQLVLHASAVAIDGSGIAFLGVSKQGKSTITSAFCSLGGALLTDDSLLLRVQPDDIYCVPSYPGVRLWPDSVSGLFEKGAIAKPMLPNLDKYRLSAADNRISFAISSVPLKKIYLLDPYYPNSCSTDIACIPLNIVESFKPILESSFRLDIANQEKIRNEFESISRVIAKVPMARLKYPYGYSFLQAIHQVILTDLR
jgi:hypothetical protein